MTTQDVYIEQAKAQLDRLNAEIKKMRAEAEATQSAGKAEFARQLDEAKQRRDEAEAELSRIAEASGAAWADMKDSFEQAHKALADGVEKARSHYSGT
jgi:hypothetical protein